MTPITFTILGEPASKANQRKIVAFGNRPALIKSDKARAYERDALAQIPPRARLQLEVPVSITIRIWYASQRPDLDASVILDVLQDRYRKGEDGSRVLIQRGVIRNDRQVRELHLFHGIDRANPRAEIVVRPLHAQQADLLAGVEAAAA